MPDGANAGARDFSLYVVQCADCSLYTGIATDVKRRLDEHRSSARGAKYLRGKGPLKLLFERPIGGRSLASKIERRVKRLPATDKADTSVLNMRIDKMLSDIESSGCN